MVLFFIIFLLTHGKFITGSNQVWVGDGNNNPINLIQDFEGGSNMIAKLVGSQDVAGALSVTPVVDDFDFIQIVRTHIGKSDVIGFVQSLDNIFISNGFSGTITLYIPFNSGSTVSVVIESVSSSEIKFKNGLKSYGYINYYKYV